MLCSCVSAPERDGLAGVADKVGKQAAKGWFESMLERFVERAIEIGSAIAAGVVTAAIMGVDLVTGGTISGVTLFVSFMFRPAQNVTNNTGGDNSTFGVGGGDESL